MEKDFSIHRGLFAWISFARWLLRLRTFATIFPLNKNYSPVKILILLSTLVFTNQSFSQSATNEIPAFDDSQNIQLAASLFGGGDAEPRLNRSRQEQEREQREQKRQEFEKRRERGASRAVWKPVEPEEEEIDEEEEKAEEEKRQYMSYFQRVRRSWSTAKSLQDVFDQSLSKGYAPAQVKESYLNLKSGPGRNYPVIFIAEEDEWIDFAGIRTDWYEIKNKDGYTGWVNLNDLPNTLASDESAIAFGDAAKKIKTRSKEIDFGMSAGLMRDEPTIEVKINYKNNPFYSTELVYGKHSSVVSLSDFYLVGLMSHPFSEWKTSPHFTMTFGKISTDLMDLTGTTVVNESSTLFRSGIGITHRLNRRFKLRADLNQLALSNSVYKNSYAQLTTGFSFIFGSATDKVFNRTIGEKVGISDFEITLYNGSVSIDDAGSKAVSGLRATYHISEDYFVEANYGTASADYSYYNLVGGYNMFPGEVTVPWGGDNSYWPTQVFVLAGAGEQSIGNADDVSFQFGAGIRLNPLRQFAIRFDVRENIVRQRIDNLFSIATNPETTFGLSYYF